MCVNKPLYTIPVLLVLFVIATTYSIAADSFRFQGRLTDSTGAPVVGPEVRVKFALYDALAGGKKIWEMSETTVQTNEAGLFATDIGPLDTNVFSQLPSLFLLVSVHDGTGFKELKPRQKLSPVPYAFFSNASSHSVIADHVIANSISSDQIQPGAVNGTHIKDKSINNNHLGASSVHDEQIMDVAASKITGLLDDAQIGSVSLQKVSDLTGIVVAFGGTSPPNGWLMCDGADISRTQYAALFRVIGTYFGAGNGSTTFNLPDLRGRFIRGVDGNAGRDPDRYARQAMHPGGNVDNKVGSIQDESYKSHSHPLTDGTHRHGLTNVNSDGAVAITRGPNGGISGGGHDGGSFALSNTEYAQSNITISNTGGQETRPENAYLNYIIKY